MKRLAASLAICAAVFSAAPAFAQFAPGGGPIDMSADQLELIDAQHTAIWSGAVEALQGRNRMRADQVKIFFNGKPATGAAATAGAAPGRNWGKVERMEAEGNVFFVSPTQTARGDHGLYELASNTITITGDVVVAQGQSVIHGTKLVIDSKTGKATMVNNGAGHGRVRGIFYPNSSTPQGAPTPPAPRQ